MPPYIHIKIYNFRARANNIYNNAAMLYISPVAEVGIVVLDKVVIIYPCDIAIGVGLSLPLDNQKKKIQMATK